MRNDLHNCYSHPSGSGPTAGERVPQSAGTLSNPEPFWRPESRSPLRRQGKRRTRTVKKPTVLEQLRFLILPPARRLSTGAEDAMVPVSIVTHSSNSF